MLNTQSSVLKDYLTKDNIIDTNLVYETNTNNQDSTMDV